MAMNVEAEIRDLKRRVGELEGSFGFLTQQVKAVHKDLLGFEAKTEERFKKVDQRFDRLDGKVDGLIKALPGIVGDAVRGANRERDKKR
jgi:predicted  nucleic acid-binding Zn-ribbon protein